MKIVAITLNLILLTLVVWLTRKWGIPHISDDAFWLCLFIVACTVSNLMVLTITTNIRYMRIVGIIFDFALLLFIIGNFFYGRNINWFSLVYTLCPIANIVAICGCNKEKYCSFLTFNKKVIWRTTWVISLLPAVYYSCSAIFGFGFVHNEESLLSGYRPTMGEWLYFLKLILVPFASVWVIYVILIWIQRLSKKKDGET